MPTWTGLFGMSKEMGAVYPTDHLMWLCFLPQNSLIFLTVVILAGTVCGCNRKEGTWEENLVKPRAYIRENE